MNAFRILPLLTLVLSFQILGARCCSNGRSAATGFFLGFSLGAAVNPITSGPYPYYYGPYPITTYPYPVMPYTEYNPTRRRRYIDWDDE